MNSSKTRKKKKIEYIQKPASKTTFADWDKIFGRHEDDEKDHHWAKREIKKDCKKPMDSVEDINCLWDLSIFSTDI